MRPPCPCAFSAAPTDLCERRCLAGRLPRFADVAAHLLSCLSDSLVGAERPACRIRQPAQSLARRAARLDCLLCSLSDVVERFCQSPARPERLLTELPDFTDGIADGVHEALEDLRIPMERCERAVEDVVAVLQPHLQQRLSVYAISTSTLPRCTCTPATT